MTISVILLLLGSLAMFACANSGHRRADRSGSLTKQVLLDDAQFENAPTEQEDDDDGQKFAAADHEARIAAAIQAAVRFEHQHAPVATPEPYKLFRARLATQARPNTCVYPCALGKFFAASNAVQAGWLQGVRATVLADDGKKFQTVFDNTTLSCTPSPCGFNNCTSCSISAPLVNNTFGYSLTATISTGSTAVTFVLLTPQGAPQTINSPLNITSLTIETQAANAANPRFGGMTFSVFSSTVGNYPNSTSGLSKDNLTKIVNGTSQYGCTPAGGLGVNPNFDGLLQADYAAISNLGVTQFTVTSNTANKFLVDNFGNASVTIVIAGINQVLPGDPTIASTYFQLGLESLPCASRGAFLYDEIATINGPISPIPELADPLANPTFYQALSAATNTAKSNLGAFLRTVRIIAGRSQLTLRDAVLDRAPFSLLSHYSKFTPCFRVYPDLSGEIGVFIGFGGKTAPANPTFVVAQMFTSSLLNTTTSPPTFLPLSADFTKRPQFLVSEVVLANLVNPLANPPVLLPRTLLLSDVSVLLDACPSFTYFQ